MNATARPVSTLLLFAGTLTGCSAMANSSVENTSIPQLAPYDGPEVRLLIEGFVWGVGGQQAGGEWVYEDSNGRTQRVSWNVRQGGLTTGLKESLKMSLTESGRFLVTDRAAMNTLRDEKDLEEEGWIDETTAIQRGHVKSPEILVRATVLEWDDDSGGSNAGLGGKLGGIFGGIGLKRERGKCVIQLEVMDARTLDSLCIRSCSGTASGWKVTGGGSLASGVALAGGLSEYEDKPMGKAIRLAIAQCVAEIVGNVPEGYFRQS